MCSMEMSFWFYALKIIGVQETKSSRFAFSDAKLVQIAAIL